MRYDIETGWETVKDELKFGRECLLGKSFFVRWFFIASFGKIVAKTALTSIFRMFLNITYFAFKRILHAIAPTSI
jgi:hypothetical protein